MKPLPIVALISGLAVVLAACGGSTAAPASSAAPATSASPIASQAAAPPSASATSAPSPVPTVGPPSASGSPPIASSAPAVAAPSTPPPTPVLPSPATVPPTAPTAAAKPTSVAPPAPPGTVTITNADQGKTFHAKIGSTVLVSLTYPSGMQPWNIQAPDPAVLASATPPPAPAGAATQAYRAIAAGTTSIMATDRAACPSGQVCPQFIQAFKATVTVDPA